MKKLGMTRKGLFSVLLAVSAVCWSQDLEFKKGWYCLPNANKEIPMHLKFGQAGLTIQAGKAFSQIEILYSSITKMSYEITSTHRTSAGEKIALISPGIGIITMLSKADRHYLTVEHKDGTATINTLLRVDKNDAEEIVGALETRTGKKVARVAPASALLDPTAGSKDINATLPFDLRAVAAEVQLAMQNINCKILESRPGRIRCQRVTGDSGVSGVGGEIVTATLIAVGQGRKTSASGHDFPTTDTPEEKVHRPDSRGCVVL